MSQCQTEPVSDVIKRHRKKAKFQCEFCGLGEEIEGDKMHVVTKDPKDQQCFSGLQDVCERYCWYHFRHKLSVVEAVIGDLDFPGGSVKVSKASTNEWQEWLGCTGWLGCPWSNMVTLFIVLRHEDIRKKI